MATSYPNEASPHLCQKLANNNMLYSIEAHPSWPVYADVLNHLSLDIQYGET